MHEEKMKIVFLGKNTEIINFWESLGQILL
jgi:hypothetical protein